MRMLYRSLPILLILGASGCKSLRSADHGPLHFSVTGVVSEARTPGDYAFADFAKTRISRTPIVKTTKAFRKIETEQIVKLDVTQKLEQLHDYQILLGPAFGSGGTAKGWLKNSEPTFYVERGWAFLSGRRVAVKSRWISGTTRGTTIVLQIVNYDLHRVFLLKENAALAYVDVTCGNGTSHRISTPGQYFDIDGACNFNGPKNIDDTAAVKTFINKVKKVAEVSGWQPS